ncbi:TonB family protein [Myxosarcina sp. GI1]|uniref:TonB family protein n=1 Tax=Myxosarcina sp. GI1 TaxID=1541065 RepID=UPI000565BC6F|nr:TonB family protein [Myxosarcina sp. GI1]
MTSVAIHLAGLLIWLWLERSPSTTTQNTPTPIEFIEVPAETATKEPPPETKRQATRNSISRGEVKPELPPANDNTGESAKELDSPPKPQTPTTTAPTAVAPQTVPTPPAPKPLEPPAKPSKTQKPSATAKAPTQSAKVAQPNSDVLTTPTSPTTTKPAAPKKESVAANSPDTGASSLLGGSYQRSFADDAGSTFFNLQANASQEAQNFSGLDARQNLEMSSYFDEIRRRVKRNWNPQVASDERHTVLTFVIQPDGNITQLTIASSSGSELADREALAAVRQSAPFEALPASYPRNSLNIEFNFNIYYR